MKRMIIVLAMVIGAITANGQTVNGIQISEIESEYLNIIISAKMFSNKVNVTLDFGQVDKLFKLKDSVILDKNQKPVTFNSAVNVLNFFTLLGYEFVDRTAVMNSQNMIIISILLKRIK